jgi:uncharacterized protein (UPF0335 family)
METLDVLLSDKFAEFSDTVARLAEQKKKLKADFKVVYDKFQHDVKEIDQAVLAAQQEFEEWKKECALNSGDG